MFSKKEILFWGFAFTVSIMLAWSCRLEAIDIQKLEEPIKKDEKVEKEYYPNFLLYNATSACMRGIVQLMVQFNPQLQNQYMPPAIQQQVLGHCSCIVDKIRVDYSLEEYTKKQNDYLWVKKIWGDYGVQCMKAGYLAGVIPDDLPEKLEKLQTDNKTKEDTKVEDNKTESLKPKSNVEETENEDTTIFQG